MPADHRSFIAKYSRILRKQLASKLVVAFLARLLLSHTRLTRRLFHIYLRTADPSQVPHVRRDPGEPIRASVPVDADLTTRVRRYAEKADIGVGKAAGRLDLSVDLPVYELADCEVLPWLGVILHRPTERVVDGGTDAQPRLVFRSRPIAGEVLSLLGSPRGIRQYYHFFQALTVVMRTLKWLGEGQPVTLLVRENPTPFQRGAIEALARRWPGLRIDTVREYEILRPERLLIPRAARRPIVHDCALIDEWREIGAMMREAYGPAPRPTGRKVHLSRRRVRLRRLLNEDALEPVFQRHGYETVAPDDLTHAEQVHLMMQSSAVAAAHGAAVTNIIFAERPIHLTVMCPREIYEPLWEALAIQLGHRITYVDGETAGWNDHFAVDPAKLDAALSAV